MSRSRSCSRSGLRRHGAAGLSIALFVVVLPSCAHHRISEQTEFSTAEKRPSSVVETKDKDESRKESVAVKQPAKPTLKIKPVVHTTTVPPLPTENDAKKPGVDSQGLTLADVERLARQHNPTLAQAQANVGSANGQWVQAGLYPNPQIGYQGNEIGNNGRAGQQGWFVSQEIVTANKLGLSQHTASHEVGRRQAQWSAQEFRVLTAVRIAFYNALVAQESVEIAEKLVDVGEQGVKSTKALKQAKQASDVEVLQSQVELNQAKILLTKARNRKQAAWNQLRSLIGKSDLTNASLQGEWQPTVQRIDRESMLQQIIAQSPEIAAAQQEMARAHAAMQRAQVEPIPNVTLQGGLQYDYSSHDPVVNLQMSLPIPIRNKNQGNILSAHSEWIAASRELERRELDISNRFALAYERYSNAVYQVNLFKTSVIPDAARSLELVREAFEKGETNYLRLLTAQRSNFQARVNFLSAVREWWSAKLEIDGLLLTDGLQRPGD